MKPLVIIPARGGSKGVPKKNMKFLNRQPLIYYTIEAAQEIFDNDVICVSTDDMEIKNLVEAIGLSVPFIRPPHLSSDTAGLYDVLLHAIEYYELKGYFPDTLILLQPTSPFRNAKHIIQALELYTSDLDMVVSVKETKSNPYFNLFEENGFGFLYKSKQSNYVRRQDAPKVWEYNGAIYIMNIERLKLFNFSSFEKIKKYSMDELSSHDIDTLFDWKLAEFIMES